MPVLLAYIPVIHQGYLQLFSEYFAVCEQAAHTPKQILLIPADLAGEFGPTHKDLHGLDVQLIAQALGSWQLFEQIVVVTPMLLEQLREQQTSLFIPEEVITQQLVAKYLPTNPVTSSSIFLRWDSKNTLKAHLPTPDNRVAATTIAQPMSSSAVGFSAGAISESQLSSDWWRQVGAVAVRVNSDGSSTIVAQAHNTHLPSEQQPYVEGDGRAQFHKGEHIDITTAIHAEAKLIAEAAKTGTSLAAAELYVTDFPCPTCAKLIATAGFTKLYYQKGYTVFDGERILTAAGIEIVQITE